MIQIERDQRHGDKSDKASTRESQSEKIFRNKVIFSSLFLLG
jgi:hypothetical protein